MSLPNVIECTVRNNYGTPTVYPHNTVAKQFCELLGTKTFTHNALCRLEAMGYIIEQVSTPLKLEDLKRG